ncbi:hypothetical protein [Xanthobacter sediminis]
MQTLSRFLPHFSLDGTLRSSREGQGPRWRSDAEGAGNGISPLQPPPPTFSQEEVGLAVSQAVREATAKAKAELAASEAARRGDAERFEVTLKERIATARAEWSEAEGDRLAGAVGEAFGVLETRVCNVLGRILSPFVGAAMRARAIEEVRHAIADLLSQPAPPDAPLPAITVRGPEDLLAVLKERLGAPEGIVFHAAPGAEIEATCADTLIETRLQAWSNLLATAQHDPVDEGGAHGG